MGRECAASGSAGYDERAAREPRVGGVIARPPVPACEETEVGGRTVGSTPRAGASASAAGEAGASADRS
jgi:hypothetical protein